VDAKLIDVQGNANEQLGAVDLLLRVTRGSDNRLSGTVRTTSAGDAHPFSGTLELMRVFEDLIPAQHGGHESENPATARHLEAWPDGGF
jgi:hypothetical protein